MSTATKRVTVQVFQEMKRREEKIAMLTAYDVSFAGIIDKAGIDAVLVGDSAANVIAGHKTTLPITLDQMIYHASAVVRGVERAMCIVDLPFGSYQGSPELALDSAVRVMKESGAHAVKLEGGIEVVESVERIFRAGIPVMGHLGLTPQSIYKFGTYSVRAKERQEADKLRSDAEALAEAGCFSIVLEKVPAGLAKETAALLSIPVIGIGAGSGVDGQVLVLYDMLGLTSDFNPRFLRRYLEMQAEVTEAVEGYISDVKRQTFPSESESY